MKNSLNACFENQPFLLYYDPLPSIIKMLFDVTLYSCCDMITIILWLFFKFPKLWDLVSAEATRMKNEVMVLRCGEDGIEARTRGMTKAPGSSHLELSIILFTVTGLGCTVQKTGVKEKQEIRMWLMEVWREYTECLCDVCGTMCFHSWVSAVHIESVETSTTSVSASWKH